MGNREYLTIDGQRYRVVPGSLRLLVSESTLGRVASENVEQLVVRTPFESWAQVGAQGGEGLETTGGPQSSGYKSGRSVQPDPELPPLVGNARLKLGPAVQTVATWGGRGAVSALAAYKGSLYVGFSVSGLVAMWNGVTWSDPINTGKAGVGALCVWKDKLYIGNLTDGAIQSWDGSTLATAFTVAGSYQGTALAVCSFGGTRLYAGLSSVLFGGQGQVVSWDGAVATAILVTDEPSVPALCAGDGVLYTAAGDPDTWRGSLHKHTSNNANSAAQVATFAGTYPVSLAVYRGELYLGMAAGASVQKLGSGGPMEVARFGGSGLPAVLPAPDKVAALLTVGDRLYATSKDLSTGKGYLRVLQGGGWHLVAEDVTSSPAPGALVQFKGFGLVAFGTQMPGTSDPQLKKLSDTQYAASGEFSSPEFDAGLPNVPKALVRATVLHKALASFESVELRYSVEGAAEVSLLTSATVGATEKAATFSGDNLKGKRVTFRHVLSGPGTSTPVWVATELAYKLSPPAKEVLVATLLLEDGPKWWDRTADGRTAEGQRQALFALRAADRGFGVTHVDGATSWTMRFAERPVVETKLEGGLDAGGTMGYRVAVALVEQ